MSRPRIIEAVDDYYTAKVREHGPTPAGVDWNGGASQAIRFDQLLALSAQGDTASSVIDYGCGSGALVDALAGRCGAFDYQGYDVSDAMVAEATAAHGDRAGVTFTSDAGDLRPADYTVASGIFNVKLETPVDEWRVYVVNTLDRMVALSRRGIAFNMLTAHADPGFIRPHLYYADPAEILDRCLRRYSRDVALRHDYELYEFTVLVRLDGKPQVDSRVEETTST
jgi:SAM-dependent methyltransferase